MMFSWRKEPKRYSIFKRKADKWDGQNRGFAHDWDATQDRLFKEIVDPSKKRWWQR